MSIEMREWKRKAIVALAISVALPWGSLVKGAANDDRSFYIDKAGKPIIEKNFDGCGDFDGQGLAPVKLDDRGWGWMNTKGELVIKPQFEVVKDFSGGVAPIKRSNKWGFVDKSGKIVIEPQFEDVGGCSEGLVAFKNADGKWGFMDKSGKPVIKPKFSLVSDFDHGLCWANGDKLMLIDKHEHVLAKFNGSHYGHFSEGLCPVECDERLYGYVNMKGQIVIKPIYRDAESFTEGLAAVTNDKNKTGFVDKTGNMVIPPQFSHSNDTHFCEGLCSVARGARGNSITGPFEVIEKTGKTVVPAKYQFVSDFHEGLATFQDHGRYGYIDKSGKVVIPAHFKSANDFMDGLAQVTISSN